MRRRIYILLTLALSLALSLVFVGRAYASVCFIPNGCTSTSTAPSYGKLLIGGTSGEYEFIASSTFPSFAPVQSVFGRTGAVTAQSGDYTTSLVTEGSNLYFTASRALAEFIANLAATTSVKSITTLPSLSLPYSQLTGTPTFTDTVGNWFPPTTNFGAAANSTSTPIWFAQGIQASSTSQFDSLNVSSSGAFRQNGSTLLNSDTSQFDIFLGNNFAQGQTYNSNAMRNVFLGSNIGGTSGTFQGADNVFLGFGINRSSVAATSLKGNVVVGSGAYSSGRGQLNVILGDHAGQTLGGNSGAANILIGAGVDTPGNATAGMLNVGNLLYGQGLANASTSSVVPIGGQAGIGTTTPYARFSIQAGSLDTNTVLFAIGSSTASGTTTLFQVGNTGSTTLGLFGQCSGTRTLTTDANGTMVCTTISGLTTSNLASANISQFTNDAGYLTSAASFSTTSASYWITATTSLPSITTLAGLSLPYSQLTGTPALFAWPFTARSYGNSTSSVIAFTQGIISNGSTTVAGLSSGAVGNNNGLLYSFSTTSMNASITGNAGTATALAANGTNCSAGSYPLGVDAGGNVENCTVAASGGAFPFTPQTGGTATGTPIYFNQGAVFVASTTFSNLSQGLAYIGSADVLQSVSTSSAVALSITGTATALAANGTNCSAGQAAAGVDASGNAETCTAYDTFAYPFIASATSSALTFSGGFVSNGSTTIPGVGSGLVGANNGLLYGFSSTSLFGYVPLNPTRAVNTTFPLQGGGPLTGDLTLTNAFSTTSNSGMSAGNLYVGSGGIFQTAASSSIFGFTPEQSLTFTTPMIRTSNTINWVGLATTSQPSSSNLLVSNGLAGVYGVATSTLTASSPLTGSLVQVGSGGALGCQSASGSQAGCLSTADWLTFNNKVATGTNFVSSNLAYFGSNGTLFIVATTTVSCGSGASCTSFVAIGSSPVTISASGGGAFAWTPTTYSGTNVNATSTSIWLKSTSPFSLIASSTFVTNASSTLESVSNTLWVGPGGTPAVDSTMQFNGDKTNSWIFGNKLSDNSFRISSSTALGSTDYFTMSKSGTYQLNQLTSNGLVLTGSGNGTLSIYAGTSCASGQFVNALSAIGGSTCAAAASFAWTPTTSFATAANATGTLLSLQGGLSASSTIRFGDPAKTLAFFYNGLGIGLGSSTPSSLWGISLGTTTVMQGAQIAVGISSSTANCSGVCLINWDTGNTQRVILGGNTSFVVNATSSNPKDGGWYTLKICQDGTGSRTGTWVTPGQLVWVGGNGATTTIASAANQGTKVLFQYDARTQRYDVQASSTIADTRTCLP